MLKKLGVVACAATLAIAGTAGVAEAKPAKTYKNCTALNKAYPHGVGLPGAHDHTSGKPVTTFKRSKALYNANSKSDRDKDGIACEKR
ncbi:MAG: excalibur calcium-binding domain-containing protein [Nocardioidaceae bacterium]